MQLAQHHGKTLTYRKDSTRPYLITGENGMRIAFKTLSDAFNKFPELVSVHIRNEDAREKQRIEAQAQNVTTPPEDPQEQPTTETQDEAEPLEDEEDA